MRLMYRMNCLWKFFRSASRSSWNAGAVGNCKTLSLISRPHICESDEADAGDESPEGNSLDHVAEERARRRRYAIGRISHGDNSSIAWLGPSKRIPPLARPAFMDYPKSAMKSISDYPKKKRGRPPTGRDPMRGFRASDEFVERIDQWAELQPEPKPTRAEAIRRLLDKALADTPLSPNLEERIAKVKAKAEMPIPKRPSPAKGVAVLEKGLAEVKLRKLVEKKGRKQ